MSHNTAFDPTYDHYPIFGQASLSERVASAREMAANALGFAKRRFRAMADTRRLSGLPDHMLKDIGISQFDLGFRNEFGRNAPWL